MTPTFARHILSLDFSESDAERMRDLSRQNDPPMVRLRYELMEEDRFPVDQ